MARGSGFKACLTLVTSGLWKMNHIPIDLGSLTARLSIIYIGLLKSNYPNYDTSYVCLDTEFEVFAASLAVTRCNIAVPRQLTWQ